MDAAIPAPGGSVGLKTFAVYAAGGAIGLAVYANYIDQMVPDSWTEWNVGPVKGVHLFMAAAAIVGAALASKVVPK